VHLGCGIVSGALGSTCVYPLQLVRTRYLFTSNKIERLERLSSADANSGDCFIGTDYRRSHLTQLTDTKA
jgi:hypothetical protein